MHEASLVLVGLRRRLSKIGQVSSRAELSLSLSNGLEACHTQPVVVVVV